MSFLDDRVTFYLVRRGALADPVGMGMGMVVVVVDTVMATAEVMVDTGQGVRAEDMVDMGVMTAEDTVAETVKT